jgi:putative addiction module component (TIGR02574 family)
MDMSDLKAIETAIAGLGPGEFGQLRRWFFEFDSDRWDKQLEQDATSGRLGSFASEALADYAREPDGSVIDNIDRELADRCRALPPEDRARLIDFLLASLRDSPSAEIEAAWEQEIERRVEAFERGEVKTYAAEDVFAEARRVAR